MARLKWKPGMERKKLEKLLTLAGEEFTEVIEDAAKARGLDPKLITFSVAVDLPKAGEDDPDGTVIVGLQMVGEKVGASHVVPTLKGLKRLVKDLGNTLEDSIKKGIESMSEWGEDDEPKNAGEFIKAMKGMAEGGSPLLPVIKAALEAAEELEGRGDELDLPGLPAGMKKILGGGPKKRVKFLKKMAERLEDDIEEGAAPKTAKATLKATRAMIELEEARIEDDE